MTLTINIAWDSERSRREDANGPTLKQAVRMAASMHDMQERANMLREHHPAAALNLDCDAFDIESDLIRYGFTQLI